MLSAAVNRCLFGDKQSVETAVSGSSSVRECQLFGKLGTVSLHHSACLLVSLACVYFSWPLGVLVCCCLGSLVSVTQR